jgi:hypothetical protein
MEIAFKTRDPEEMHKFLLVKFFFSNDQSTIDLDKYNNSYQIQRNE